MQTKKADQNNTIVMKKCLLPLKQPFTFSDFVKYSQKFRINSCGVGKSRQRQRKGKISQKINGYNGEKIALAKNPFQNLSFLNGSQFFDKKQIYLERKVRKNQRFYTQSINPEKILINRLQNKLFTSQPIQRNTYSSGDKKMAKIKQISYKQVSEKKIKCYSLSIRLYDRDQSTKNSENPLSFTQYPRQNGINRQSQGVLGNKGFQKELNFTDKRQKIRIGKMSKIRKEFFNE